MAEENPNRRQYDAHRDLEFTEAAERLVEEIANRPEIQAEARTQSQQAQKDLHQMANEAVQHIGEFTQDIIKSYNEFKTETQELETFFGTQEAGRATYRVPTPSKDTFYFDKEKLLKDINRGFSGMEQGN